MLLLMYLAVATTLQSTAASAQLPWNVATDGHSHIDSTRNHRNHFWCNRHPRRWMPNDYLCDGTEDCIDPRTGYSYDEDEHSCSSQGSSTQLPSTYPPGVLNEAVVGFRRALFAAGCPARCKLAITREVDGQPDVVCHLNWPRSSILSIGIVEVKSHDYHTQLLCRTHVRVRHHATVIHPATLVCAVSNLTSLLVGTTLSARVESFRHSNIPLWSGIPLLNTDIPSREGVADVFIVGSRQAFSHDLIGGLQQFEEGLANEHGHAWRIRYGLNIYYTVARQGHEVVCHRTITLRDFKSFRKAFSNRNLRSACSSVGEKPRKPLIESLDRLVSNCNTHATRLMLYFNTGETLTAEPEQVLYHMQVCAHQAVKVHVFAISLPAAKQCGNGDPVPTLREVAVLTGGHYYDYRHTASVRNSQTGMLSVYENMRLRLQANPQPGCSNPDAKSPTATTGTQASVLLTQDNGSLPLKMKGNDTLPDLIAISMNDGSSQGNDSISMDEHSQSHAVQIYIYAGAAVAIFVVLLLLSVFVKHKVYRLACVKLQHSSHLSSDSHRSFAHSSSRSERAHDSELQSIESDCYDDGQNADDECSLSNHITDEESCLEMNDRPRRLKVNRRITEGIHVERDMRLRRLLRSLFLGDKLLFQPCGSSRLADCLPLRWLDDTDPLTFQFCGISLHLAREVDVPGVMHTDDWLAVSLATNPAIFPATPCQLAPVVDIRSLSGRIPALVLTHRLDNALPERLCPCGKCCIVILQLDLITTMWKPWQVLERQNFSSDGWSCSSVIHNPGTYTVALLSCGVIEMMTNCNIPAKQVAPCGDTSTKAADTASDKASGSEQMPVKDSNPPDRRHQPVQGNFFRRGRDDDDDDRGNQCQPCTDDIKKTWPRLAAMVVYTSLHPRRHDRIYLYHELVLLKGRSYSERPSCYPLERLLHKIRESDCVSVLDVPPRGRDEFVRLVDVEQSDSIRIRFTDFTEGVDLAEESKEPLLVHVDRSTEKDADTVKLIFTSAIVPETIQGEVWHAHFQEEKKVANNCRALSFPNTCHSLQREHRCPHPQLEQPEGLDGSAAHTPGVAGVYQESSSDSSANSSCNIAIGRRLQRIQLCDSSLSSLTSESSYS